MTNILTKENIIGFFNKINSKIIKIIEKINQKDYLQYIVYSLIILGISALITNHFIITNLNKNFILSPTLNRIIDFIIFSMLFYPLFLVSKNKKIFFLTEFLFALFQYGINALKYRILISPVRYFELTMVKEIFLALPLIYSATFTVFSILILVLIFINIDYKNKVKFLPLFLILPIFIAIGIIFAKPMENIISKVFIRETKLESGLCKRLGNFFYLYYDMTKINSLNSINFTEKEVKEAIHNIYPLKDSYIPSPQKRNVFLIAFESLTDMTRYMEPNELNRHLFEDRFLKLYKESESKSIAMSNFTGNGLYELLCGFPLLRHVIIFYENLNEKLPCIARELSSIGYRTTSYQMSLPPSYNFKKVLPKIGFDKSYFVGDIYDKNKKGFEGLRDRQLLNFIVEDFRKNYKKGEGSFNFALTVTTHFSYDDYISNKLKDKIKIQNEDKSDDIRRFANSTYYATKAMSDFIEEIFKIDKNALIIITADHPVPSIHRGYKGKNDNTVYGLTVPLIIIDGKDNILKNITQVHYKTAKTIYKILEMNVPVVNYSNDLYNLRFLTTKDKYIKIDENLKSKDLDKQKTALEVIFYDIFYGKQYYKKYID